MTVDIDVLIALLLIALGVGFTVGVYVGDGRNYRRKAGSDGRH